MMWWLAWCACELVVDFDPDATTTSSTGSTAATGDTGGIPEDVPPWIRGTECSGTASEPVVSDIPIDGSSSPITEAITFADVAIEELVFGVDVDVEVAVGDVAGPRVEPPAEEGAVVFARVEEDTLFVLSFCALTTCTGRTLRITLPQPVPRILGEVATGDLTLTNAAVTDAWVATNLGDVRVTGDTRRIHAEALDGSIQVDAPSARIVDLHASTGPISMRGSATAELCAISELGDLDVVLDASERVSLRATNGAIVADLATRAAQLELALVVGGADVRLPGGAYDIDLVSIPESNLTLEGIVHDQTADDRITGSSLGKGVVLRAR